MDEGQYGNAGSRHVHADRRGMSHPEDEMHTVDLHFHLLPGVDDGPAEMGDSIELARLAVAQGTGTVVATPHVRSDFFTDVPSLPERLDEVRRALTAEGIVLELLCGGELGHDMVGRLSQSELETIAQGPPGARWLLVETPFEGVDEAFHGATAELRDRGFGVLVAHPERSADAALDGSAGLRYELAAGSRAQLNALSLTGDHGEDACSAAWELISEGLIDVVASDAHGPSRPPALTLARRTMLEVGISSRVAESLIGSAPHRLLAAGIASARAVAA
jgi:protein-tyrosine phosphatase